MAQPLSSPADPSLDEPVEPVPATATPEWSPALRIAFRFVFSYLVFYNFDAIGYIPGTGKLLEADSRLWQELALWVGRNVLHLRGPIPIDPELGGDTTVGFLRLLAMVTLAALAALVWTLVDRRSRQYRQLHDGLRLAVRYILGFTMFSYGMIKIIQTQFIQMHFARLQETYGELSPMGLLWTFMSYSAAYNVFTGGLEATAGLLLFFRRTTTLGALLAVAVLSHVVMINFSYDVIVKLYSTNLLLMGVFLLAPDLRRLADLLVFNRPTRPPARAPRRFDRGWVRIGRLGLKFLVIGYILVSMTEERLEMKKRLDARRARHRHDTHFFLTDRGFHWINEVPMDR
jgi:hypothetical protein